MSQNNFVGRDHEKKRLEAFLNNGEGGSVLVAGRRGSGKTTLLRTVLASRVKHDIFLKKYKRWTLNKSVQVHIPLIIVAEKQATKEIRHQAEIYRSLILRSIVFALLTHINKRQFNKLPLPTRYFLSIGLVRKIKKLEKYVELLSLVRQNPRVFGLGYRKVDISSQNGYVGSIDLSDSKIEMLLYDIFESFAQQTEFVFVFDEMDKLEGTVPIQDVVLYLKNLFSDTGVHAIFLCNENQGYEAIKHKDSTDDSKYTTLFRDIVIIKGVDPLDLSTLLENQLIGDKIKIQAVTAGIAIVTDNYPIRINDILIMNDNDIDRLFEYLSEEIGVRVDGYATAGRLFVDHVYARYKKQYNSDYNYLLHKVLCEVSEIIVENKTKYVSATKLSSILYTTDLFDDADLEKQYKQGIQVPGRIRVVPSAKPGLITKIESAKYLFEYAISDILTLYERAKWLEIDKASGASNLINLASFNGDTFSFANVSQNFDSAYQLNNKELKIKTNAQKYISPFRAFSNKSDYWSNNDFPVTPFAGLGGDQATIVDLHDIGNTRKSWSNVEAEIDEAESHLLKAFIEKLDLSTSLEDLEINNKLATFKLNDNKVKLVFEFPNDKISKDNSFDKTIIIRTPLLSSPKIHSSKIKYFEFTDWEDNTDDTLEEIKSYLKNL